jgi:hypothetical protein
MKLTYPEFKNATRPTKKPLTRIIGMIWSTIIPCTLTYLATKYELWLFIPPIIISLIWRIDENL